MKPSYLQNFSTINSTLSEDDMEQIKGILLKCPSPSTIPLINHFSIRFEDLKLGVKCESCSFIGMQKIIRTWYCPKCSKTNSYAHYKAISTYFSLCKETITNKECRDFLLLNNRNEAKRILSNSGIWNVEKALLRTINKGYINRILRILLILFTLINECAKVYESCK